MLLSQEWTAATASVLSKRLKDWTAAAASALRSWIKQRYVAVCCTKVARSANAHS
jgi:hypothetical protein